MSLVHRYERNTEGRDFVVGDIHGCFDEVQKKLDELSFDVEKDRLFSVGDLVDRGPHSEESIDWLAKPWFHAVRGNHEQMAIGISQGKHSEYNYAVNGGHWFLDKSLHIQSLYADVFQHLPIMIEVDVEDGKIGIIHADIFGDDWDFFAQLIEEAEKPKDLRDLMEHAMWNRDRIRYKDDSIVKGVRNMYVGHTPVKESITLGNTVYVDTGLVFGNEVTIIQINGEA